MTAKKLAAYVVWKEAVYPYQALKATNVLGTKEIIRLTALGKSKALHHISAVDVFLRGEDRLPYAGAGAAAYPDWPGLVPGLEVIGTRLPGRESRLSEPPIASVAEMARTLVAKFATLPAKPVALYGHSLGGLIAFETALALQRQGRPPVADREPGAGKSHASLSMPLVVLAGRDDASVSSKEVWAWREHSSGDLSFHLIPGGHFFVHQESARVGRLISHHFDLALARSAG